ncbi:hypothetical protein DFS33DRAFT_1348898 [Desarmillaria ectypa]|nr:hypothetical protein DFS33DRAFT_1348898 [Desarmillaria ectypa]
MKQDQVLSMLQKDFLLLSLAYKRATRPSSASQHQKLHSNMFSRAFIFVTFIAAVAMSASVKAKCDDGTPGYTHIVVSNNTCWDIATEGGTSVSRLEATNPGIDCDNLQIGDALCSP